jgi:predicted phosphodiesterase
MRIAVLSDIHGNRTAFEAVLADLRGTSPDLILHGGDLADGGARPAEMVDWIRDLGWRGVAGNADEMLWRPDALTEFAAEASAVRPLLNEICEIAAATRELLGEERVGWLSGLPGLQVDGPVALVHASPASLWRAPGPEASDGELEDTYGCLGSKVAIYGHIHRPYVRRLARMTVVNTGSVSLSYDGDRRASYLLIEESGPVVRRVEYDVDREIAELRGSGIPHSGWLAKMLTLGKFAMP